MNYKELFSYVIKKLILTFSSLKTWGLVFISITSYILAYNEIITGKEWSETIIATYAILFGLREYSKNREILKLKK